MFPGRNVYDNSGTAILNNRNIRHEYQQQIGNAACGIGWQQPAPAFICMDKLEYFRFRNMTGKKGAKENEWLLVGMTGFEPATPASRTLCSTRLSHIPTTEFPQPPSRKYIYNYGDQKSSIIHIFFNFSEFFRNHSDLIP